MSEDAITSSFKKMFATLVLVFLNESVKPSVNKKPDRSRGKPYYLTFCGFSAGLVA